MLIASFKNVPTVACPTDAWPNTIGYIHHGEYAIMCRLVLMLAGERVKVQALDGGECYRVSRHDFRIQTMVVSA